MIIGRKQDQPRHLIAESGHEAMHQPRVTATKDFTLCRYIGSLPVLPDPLSPVIFFHPPFLHTPSSLLRPSYPPPCIRLPSAGITQPGPCPFLTSLLTPSPTYSRMSC